MTLAALQAAVCTCQRELRFRMVEHSAGPGRGRMASRAISGETRLHVVGGRCAVVQRNVASAAVGRRACKGSVRVALSTLDRAMRAG